MKSVCVYCGANSGSQPEFVEAAKLLGDALARQGIQLIYGGGSVGLMGVIADTVMSRGGQVIGVITQDLKNKEVAHLGLDELIIVETMHQRKAMMIERSDGFIALPGGYGTLDEFFESLTWAQLSLHNKPCGLLNIAGYYDALLQFIDRAVDTGFVRRAHQDMVIVDTNPDSLLEAMHAYIAPSEPKWND